MTGYGRFELLKDNKNVLVEIKSVNHRYSDFTIKVPRHFGFLEDKIRDFIKAYIKRGKVDVFVSVHSKDEEDKIITLNHSFAKSYIDALIELKESFNLKDDISVSTIAKNADIFDLERKETDENKLWELVREALNCAVLDFMDLRIKEGIRLSDDLLSRCDFIIKTVSDIEKLVPMAVNQYKEKLKQKIEEILNGATYDESRLLTEVAIFSDKIATDEETVRLISHIDEMKIQLSSDEPVGRKLDFIVQEMNREINTIGSKANDINISRLVLEVKSEIEKIREQIQNIE